MPILTQMSWVFFAMGKGQGGEKGPARRAGGQQPYSEHSGLRGYLPFPGELRQWGGWVRGTAGSRAPVLQRFTPPPLGPANVGRTDGAVALKTGRLSRTV